MRKNSFHFSSKRQLARAKMNKYVPQIIGVDLSYTTRNFTYKNIVTCEAIKKMSLNMKPLHINLNHILSLNAKRRMKKIYDKNINEERKIKYEYEK